MTISNNQESFSNQESFGNQESSETLVSRVKKLKIISERL